MTKNSGLKHWIFLGLHHSGVLRAGDRSRSGGFAPRTVPERTPFMKQLLRHEALEVFKAWKNKTDKIRY